MIRLSVSDRGASPRLVTFDTAHVHVGRSDECELPLDIQGVSSRHCRFSRAPGGVLLEDMGSTNGTYVNRQRIQGPVVVTPRDEIIVATVELRLQEVSAPRPSPHPATMGQRPPSGVSVAPSSPGRVAATNLDPDWARQWEKLDSLARAWIAANRDAKRLLRGDKLAHARAWLASGRGKMPAPKAEHRDFIFASSRARRMRVVRNLTIGLFAAIVLVVGGLKLSQIVGGADPSDVSTHASSSDGSTQSSDRPTGVDSQSDPMVEVAAQAAASALETNPTLAVLLSAVGFDAADPLAHRTPPEEPFRAAMGALRGTALRGHEEMITAATFAPNGRWVVTSSRDGSVRMWNPNDPASRATSLRGHSRGVLDVAITPDSRFLFTSGENGKVLRWDLNAADVVSNYVSLGGHSTAVGELVVSRDGRWLVSGSADGSVRVWGASSPVPKSRVFPGHDAPIRALGVSNDGGIVVAASQDGTASIWRSNEGAPGRRTTLEAGTDEAPAQILDIDISGDGTWVVTGHSDGTARLWDPSRRIPKLTALTMEGHVGAVPHVAFTPDSTLAITAGDDQKLRIWNLEAKDPSLSAPTFDLHEGRITNLVALDVPGPGAARRRLAATASEDGTVRTWNLERRDHEQDSRVFETNRGHATAVAVSADGQRVVGGSNTGMVTMWPARSSAPLGPSKVGWGHTQQVLSVVVNPVGTRMVSASADGTARVWDLTTPGRAGAVATLGGHEGQVLGVAMSPDGKFVATGSSTGEVRMWDITKPDPGANSILLAAHRRAVHAMAFTQDGKRLISQSTDRTSIWSVAADIQDSAVELEQDDELIGFSVSDDGATLIVAGVREIRVLDLSAADIAASAKALRRVHGLDVLEVAVSPDGRWAASSAKDATLVLWDLEHGAKALEVLLHEQPVDALAFGPKGRRLATGSQDSTVRIWDLTAPQPNRRSLHVLTGPQQRVSALQWSADGRRLLTASNDQVLRVYDLSAAEPNDTVVNLRGHTGLISGIGMSEDASVVVSSSYDLTARAWPLTAEKLRVLGCARAGRTLTPDEWTTHFEGRPFRRVCG